MAVDGKTDALAGADERSELVAIVDSSFDAIISKDLNGIIRSWNHAAQVLFGYTPEEAVGQSIMILIPDDRRDEEASILARIRAGKRVEPFETIRRRKDGKLIHVELTISPLRSLDGRIYGASKIARDISTRKEVEQRINLLMREVNHRVKNQYAVILAMIRETNKHTSSAAEFERQIRERIMALSSSHDLLVIADWKGATISELILAQLKPFDYEKRVDLAGPSLILSPNAVQHLGIAFHELATNSTKYGVLSGRTGKIAVDWIVVADPEAGDMLELKWKETGGPAVTAPGNRGFGSVVLERVTPQSLDGKASLAYPADGVSWTLRAPLATVEAALTMGLHETLQQLG